MIVTEVVPRTLESADVSTEEGRAWLAERYAPGPGVAVRLNMITSVTGAAVGADGTSDTLTSRVDRAVLGVIRRAADVVVVGAQSVRAEGYLVPKTARLAVVTASGDLRGHRIAPAPGSPPVLLLVPADRRAQIERRVDGEGLEVIGVPGGGRLDPADLIALLAARGLPHIVCEGGPSLASQFAAAGAIDEYCLTVAPAIEWTEHPFLRVDRERMPRTEVAGMLVDEAGFSYLRLRARA